MDGFGKIEQRAALRRQLRQWWRGCRWSSRWRARFGETLTSRVTVGSGRFAAEPHHGGVGAGSRRDSGGAAAGGLVDRLQPGDHVATAKLARSGGVAAVGSHRTDGEAGAAAPLVARYCQNHPRTSAQTQRTSWYPPHLTHVLAPVVCRAARGRAADRRRVAPRGTRLSEKRAAVTHERNFPKRNSLQGGHAAEIFSKKKDVWC